MASLGTQTRWPRSGRLSQETQEEPRLTPQQFHDAYFSTAEEVSAGTGIDPIALLAQWANETDWGTSWLGSPYNLANIRNGPGGIIESYASLGAFVQACIATYHNGFYPEVLAASNAADQLAAIVASPWSAGHYGGSLDSFYSPLEAFDLTPGEHYALVDTQNKVANTVMPELAALKAQIAAIPTATASVNLQPVLDGIAALNTAVTAITAKVVAIEAKIDADLH